MLSFSNFLIEETKIKRMNSKEGHPDGDRHFRKYVNAGENVTLARDHQGLDAGESLEVVDKRTVNGIHHAIVNKDGKEFQIPIHNLVKPPGKENKGLSYEESFVKHLRDNNLMKPGSTGAGFTSGNDFHLYDKKNDSVYEGHTKESVSPSIGGEAKESLKADFGQLTLNHTPEKGWHIPESGRQRRPSYAEQIENAEITINGKRKKLLDHINETVPPPIKGKKSDANFYSDETDLTPVHSYLSDHHVDVLQIGSHGTYRGGLSREEDRSGLGLPVIEGNGRFRVRGKHSSGNLMVSFNPRNIKKSNIDIHKNQKDVEAVKRKLNIDKNKIDKNKTEHRPLEVNTSRLGEHFFSDFKSYLLIEEALRKGISHPKDLKYEHVKNLLSDGAIRGHLTEKSDGMAFAVGHDENGFYTRTSRSDKMRNPGDYEAAARARFGEDFDPSISQHFDRIHRELQNNKNLTSYLQNHQRQNGGDSLIKGEMFYRPHGTPAEDGGIRFVGTSYDPNRMGSTGSFILHSRLPENEKHFPEVIKQLGDDKINFDHDIVPDSAVNIDAKDLKQKFDEINPDILASRKKADADDKAIHRQKLDDINTEIEKRIRSKSDTIKPKWGKETEGHVFHPDTEGGPLVKVTSSTFKAFKASGSKPGNFN